MKTLRYRIGNSVKPGILDSNGGIRDASSLVSDWDADNVDDETEEQKIARLGARPTSYSS